MTRIVAGRYHGRNLQVPRTGTRPTSEMAREAIFSHLESRNYVSQARVLDLFAGSGAMGLEALSRGAKSAVFVESGVAAAKVIRMNISSLGVPDQTQVVVADALKAAERLRNQAPFGLIIADPPYDLDPDYLAQVLHKLRTQLCGENTIVVLEGAKRYPRPALPQGLNPYAEKTYGDTRVTYLECWGTSSGPEED